MVGIASLNNPPRQGWPDKGDGKVVRRIPFKIGQPKKQIVPKTVERDFEREYGKLQQLEDQTKKLQKDMKKSTDADLAMSKSAVKISSDLLSNPLCEQEPSFLEMVTAFDTAMKRMDSFNQEKVNQIQKTVIEPLKKFSSVFPSLNMAVKRREQTLQDYKRLQSKVEKYEEKERTGPVLAKLHQAREELRPVKEDFEAKNKQLLEEMPKFYSSRIDYFKPSFESLVRAQRKVVQALVAHQPLAFGGFIHLGLEKAGVEGVKVRQVCDKWHRPAWRCTARLPRWEQAMPWQREGPRFKPAPDQQLYGFDPTRPSETFWLGGWVPMAQLGRQPRCRVSPDGVTCPELAEAVTFNTKYFCPPTCLGQANRGKYFPGWGDFEVAT
ncbi:PREDICTED: bridging integrator 3 [Charadrius vociferus]|uniref:bridging integrator 3 n=2 Tax=Neoaves TaxID=3078114 RepID=UPI0005214988|nr:PREDICTED: bridging integrator 3 [Charadrius vociferus]